MNKSRKSPRISQSGSGSRSIMDTLSWSLVALLGLTLLSTGVVAQDDIGCYVSGECAGSTFVGYDGDSPSAVNCLHFCKNTLGCEYFTYYEVERSCLAFLACSNLTDVGCNGCISGDVECEDVQCDLQGLCYGDLVSMDTIATKEQCIDACKDEGNCNWWSFDTEEKHCLQMENCGFLDTDYDMVITGMKDCDSTPIDPPPVLDFSKLLVIGGYNPYVDPEDSLKSVELLNLSDDTCPMPAEFPVGIEETMAVNMNRSAVVCGGYGKLNDGPFSECWQLQTDMNWTVAGMMPTPRERHAGITWDDDSVWITGGRTGPDSSDITSSTLIFADGNFDNGPALPVPMEFHCVVKVSDNYAIFAGGYNIEDAENSATRKAYLYTRDFNNFTELPDMIDGRNGHVCEVVESAERGTELIVAGGGSDKTSVEVFNFATRDWHAGTNLPKPISWASSVVYESTFYILGGGSGQGDYYDSVIRYNVEDQTWTEVAEMKLSTPRYDHVSVYMDSEYLGCMDPPASRLY